MVSDRQSAEVSVAVFRWESERQRKKLLFGLSDDEFLYLLKTVAN